MPKLYLLSSVSLGVKSVSLPPLDKGCILLEHLERRYGSVNLRLTTVTSSRRTFITDQYTEKHQKHEIDAIVLCTSSHTLGLYGNGCSCRDCCCYTNS